jgi:uncharacterized protein (DUF427 family)
MARATWNGVVLAETGSPVLLEGNVYFPAEDVRQEHLVRTRAWSVCPWKGVARYYTVRAGGRVNKNAAWYYPHPSPLARKIKNHVAFWNGVQVDLEPATSPSVGGASGPPAAAQAQPSSGREMPPGAAG